MTCPHCSSPVPRDSEVCSACGHRLDTPQQDKEQWMFCPRCGGRNRPTALYCANCSQLLDSTEDASSSTTEPEESTTFRPKTLTELVSESYEIYVGNFVPFFIIAVLAQMPLIATSALSGMLLAIMSPVILIFASLGQGALVFAVSQQYLHRPIRIVECYTRAWDRVVSLVLVFIALGALTIGVPLLIGLFVQDFLWFLWFPIMVLLVVRWFCCPQVVMIEGKRHLNVFRRSHELVLNHWWRLFGIGAAFLLLIIGASLLFAIPGQLVGLWWPIPGRVITVLSEVAVAPMAGIGATVVYLDLRGRKEEYSLERLAKEIGP